MIRGVVNASREAIVPLQLRGPAGTVSEVDAIVDTGFTSSLTLSAAMVSSLGLTRLSAGEAVLADGTVRAFDIYEAEVFWAKTGDQS